MLITTVSNPATRLPINLASITIDEMQIAEELSEKAIIEEYLPEQMSEADITALVEKTIAELGASGPQAMGQVIGKVKAATGSAADGALIAKIVKENLR